MLELKFNKLPEALGKGILLTKLKEPLRPVWAVNYVDINTNAYHYHFEAMSLEKLLMLATRFPSLKTCPPAKSPFRKA